MKEKVLDALSWRLCLQLISQLVSWGATIFVIRWLEPTDYGLFAMAQFVTSLALLLSEGGVASVLIRTERLTPEKIQSIFGFQLVFCGSLTVAVALCAPLVARYYDEPLIARILWVQSLLCLLVPFTSIPAALLNRNMNFKETSYIDFGSFLIMGLLSLVLAYMGFGVWSLVISPILAMMFKAIAYAAHFRWVVWPQLSFSAVKSEISFGTRVMLNSILFTLSISLAAVIGGKRTTAEEVGFYTTAFTLASLAVSRVVPLVNQVAFAAYSRLNEQGDAISDKFLKSIGILSLIIYPCLFGMAAVAEPFALTVLGPRWVGSIQPIRLLSLMMPLYFVYVVAGPPILARGRADVATINILVSLVVFGLTYWLFAPVGAVGLAGAWIVSMPVLLAFALIRSMPIVGVGWRALGQRLLPATTASMIMGAVVWQAQTLTDVLPAPAELIVLLVIGVAAYLLSLVVLFRESLKQARQLFTRG